MGERLAGKTALVVGSARGIGRATAEAFVAEGADVIGLDLRESEPIRSANGSHEHHLMDATDEDAVAARVHDVLDRFGRIDVAFLNVGRHLGKPITATSVEEFDSVMSTNVLSTFLGVRAVLPSMIRQQSGSIVCVSSNGGIMGRPNDPVYNASKHAIVGLVRSVAVAHAHHGVRINAIAPGAIDTDMFRSTLPTEPELDLSARMRTPLASTPAARVGLPREVAALAVLLASDEAAFICGAVVPIDGAKSAGTMPNERYDLEFSPGVDLGS